MAAAFHLPLTAAQVGTYFVGQYYQVLQQQPEFVHQFYSDASTMLRVDGNVRETATAMLRIHSLIMSLNFTGIEIKTVHSLESWNGGVLVMVTGSVQTKDIEYRKKFAQTFFLAPQEKGYFVLNDIFHFIDEEIIHPHPTILLAQSNFDLKPTAPPTIPEPVSNYPLGGEVQLREFVAPVDVKENGPVNDNYNFPEQQLQQASESENILEDHSAEVVDGVLQNTVNNAQEPLSAPLEEPAGEPQRHTYASILRVAKGQSAPSVATQPSSNKNALPASEWHQVPQSTTQQSVASPVAYEGSGAEAAEEVVGIEDEGEIKSVYVRNLPSTVSASEIEEEFKNFGKLKPDGVVIRNRKDVGVCYAFVEFDDITGVQNAIKASTVQITGRQVYIEERRANSNIPSRGGRRGRGRSNYLTEASRGRHGARSFGRGSVQDGGDREYSRPRANGFYRLTARHEKGGYSGNHVPRNSQIPAELSS